MKATGELFSSLQRQLSFWQWTASAILAVLLLSICYIGYLHGELFALEALLKGVLK